MIPWLEPASPVLVTSSRLGPSPREVRLKIIIAALLLVSAGLIYYQVQAPGRSPEARQAQVESLESNHRIAQTRLAQLRELTRRVQAATQTGQSFATGNFLGRANAFSTMVRNLEELASENNLQPSNISYRLLDETNELGWTGVEVSLALEGEYSSVVRFINKLEKSKIFWIIRGLNVTGAKNSILRLNLTTETYLLPS